MKYFLIMFFTICFGDAISQVYGFNELADNSFISIRNNIVESCTVDYYDQEYSCQEIGRLEPFLSEGLFHFVYNGELTNLVFLEISYENKSGSLAEWAISCPEKSASWDFEAILFRVNNNFYQLKHARLER